MNSQAIIAGARVCNSQQRCKIESLKSFEALAKEFAAAVTDPRSAVASALKVF